MINDTSLPILMLLAITVFIVLFVLLSFIANFVVSLKNRYGSKNRFGFRGEICYLDDHKHSVLINHKYKLKAKPDFLYRISPNKICLVEYKNREEGIYKSDIQQIYVTALCAREQGYNVTEAVLATKTKNYKIKLNRSDKFLFSNIEKGVSLIKNIKYNNLVPNKKYSAKCRGCGKKTICWSKT